MKQLLNCIAKKKKKLYNKNNGQPIYEFNKNSKLCKSAILCEIHKSRQNTINVKF